MTAIAIIPSAPVLVPELAGAAADETADLRAAVLACAGELPDRWIAVGVDADDATVGPDAVGTFAGYGVDIPVALSPDAVRPAPVPLCGLVAGWVRGQVAPAASVQVRTFIATRDLAAAVDHGQRLRAEIDQAGDAVGVLVVADGVITLTPSAPGGHDPDSDVVQSALDDALATGDCAALVGLPDGVVGRVAYAVLAGLADPAPGAAVEHYRGAPYGVGYFAGVWRP